jgi:hypothetical protein
MEKSLQQEFFGVPILSTAEQEDLWEQAFGRDYPDDPTLVYDVAGTVVQCRPGIELVIESDLETLAHDVDIYKEESEQGRLYRNGVRQGYLFIVGCITFIRYNRTRETHEQNTIYDYIYAVPTHSHELPLTDETQTKHVIDCITGEAPIDTFVPEPNDPPRISIVSEDASDYFKRSALIKTIVVQEQGRLQHGKLAYELRDVHVSGQNSYDHLEDPGSSPLAEGFHRGTQGGISMYMQSHQQITIDFAEADVLS